MPQKHPIIALLDQDSRYKVEAYQFVREGLSYAQDVLGMGGAGEPTPREQERHLTGQQLCESIRLYALEQYGLMARTVLNSWGVYTTSDFGEIVYNLIRIEMMKKSPHDRREDFDDVYDFEEALEKCFEIKLPEA